MVDLIKLYYSYLIILMSKYDWLFYTIWQSMHKLWYHFTVFILKFEYIHILGDLHSFKFISKVEYIGRANWIFIFFRDLALNFDVVERIVSISLTSFTASSRIESFFSNGYISKCSFYLSHDTIKYLSK